MCQCVCGCLWEAKCCGKLPADATNICATSIAAAYYVGHKSLSSTSCRIRRPGQPEARQSAAVVSCHFSLWANSILFILYIYTYIYIRFCSYFAHWLRFMVLILKRHFYILVVLVACHFVAVDLSPGFGYLTGDRMWSGPPCCLDYKLAGAGPKKKKELPKK